VNGWTDVFLGLIALATVTMAAMQIGVLIVASRLASKMEQVASRVDQQVQPLLRQLEALGREASRTASLATAQVERADALFADLAQRLGTTVDSVQHTMAAPARETVALLKGLQAAVAAIRSGRSGGRSRGRGEDEDALFI
jgi:hypothetical protein